MLCAFFGWGVVMPHLHRWGFSVDRLITIGVPLSLGLLALNVGLGAGAGALHWAAWCVSCTCIALSQPAVAQVFPTALAGRALSAFNLVLFLGVFSVQWGVGVGIDALMALGWPRVQAFRAAFAAFGVAALASYGWFVLWRGSR
jgi:hypothetical protein